MDKSLQTDKGEDRHHQAGDNASPGEELGIPCPGCSPEVQGPSWTTGDITPTVVTQLGLPLRLVACFWRRLMEDGELLLETSCAPLVGSLLCCQQLLHLLHCAEHLLLA